MNRQYEQKHLLYHWSNCRHRDRPQTPWTFLGVAFAGEFVASKGLSFAGAHCENGKRFGVRVDERLSAFLQFESVSRAC